MVISGQTESGDPHAHKLGLVDLTFALFSDISSFKCHGMALSQGNCRLLREARELCALPCRTLAEMAAATSVHVVAVIEPIIQHADWFFPGGN